MLHLQDSLRRTLENRRSTKCEARQTMNVIEGIGSSNGVNYAYTLNSSPWHASYEWRVHRSLLDQSCKIHTNRFSVGGVFWRVYLTHLDSEQVVVKLKSWNWGRVNAHYAFTLVNHANCMENLCRSGLGDFLLTSCKEVGPLMKSSEIKDPLSGFLKDDMLTLRMDLRIRRRINEHFSLSMTGRALTCKWSLKHAWEMCPSSMCTDVFKIEDREMQLEFQEERSSGVKKGVSVLLRNLSHLPVHVRGELHMRNRRDSELVERIDAGSAKGWIQILKEQDFVDGCSAKDGWLTLTTNVTLLTPKDFENTTVLIPKHLSSDVIPKTDVQHPRLTIEKGNAVTDAIKHAHMITRNKWCASYKWFVHRSLLEMTNKAIFTNPFAVEETQWSIEMGPSRDGTLECCLCSKNETPVAVQFEWTLVNFADAAKSIGRGNCHTFFHADDRLGFSFLPCVDIESFDSGYVQDEYVLARLDLRLKKEDNESCQIFVDDNSAKCEWKLRSVGDTHPPYLRTETFTFGDAQLQLFLRPKNADGSGPLEIFVSNLHCELVRMKGNVRVICHSGTMEDDRVKDFHCIVSPKSSYGSGIFMDLDELKDELAGFVKDGWIFLAIQITQLTELEFEDMSSTASRLPNKMLCSTEPPILDDLMRVEEGNGASDGSAYTFVLNTYKYYATYECCVDRSFLDKANSQIETDVFGLGDGKWKIALVHKEDGQLKALLCYEGEGVTSAHFSFVVVNGVDSKNDLVLGDFRSFSSEALQDKWGFDLCPVATIKDPPLGFLRDDRFTVRLELRLKLPENEIWGTSITQKTARCTWMLKDLKDLSPLLLKSEIFKIDGTEWRLRLCPNGETSDSDSLEMYLINKQNYPIRARIGFCAVNHKSSATSGDKIRGFTKVIDAHSGWGVGKFVESDEMVDESLGFVDKGWISIAAKITVLEDEIPQSVFSKSASMSSALRGTNEHLCCRTSSAKLPQESLDVDPATKDPECQETADGVAVHSTSVENEDLELWRCQSTMEPILVDDGPN